MIYVGVCCFDRPENMEFWLKAWRKMDTTDAKLIFVLTGPVKPPAGANFIRFPNAGMDIGAFQRFLWMPFEWDRVLWCPDDMIPMRPDLLTYYQTADLVGTYWSNGDVEGNPGVEMIRSGGFSVTKEVANLLEFPAKLLMDISKEQCYRFEFGDYNFYKQVKKMGKSIRLADGSVPPDSPPWTSVEQDYLWDRGHFWMISEESQQRHKQRFLEWIKNESCPMLML